MLTIAHGNPGNAPNRFTQMEANFSLFFGLAVQAYEQLTIPDDTPWDQFNDDNPLIGNAVAQPGEQGTLPPAVIPGLVDAPLDLSALGSDAADIIFGFDIFAGANLTAALEPARAGIRPDTARIRSCGPAGACSAMPAPSRPTIPSMPIMG